MQRSESELFLNVGQFLWMITAWHLLFLDPATIYNVAQCGKNHFYSQKNLIHCSMIAVELFAFINRFINRRIFIVKMPLMSLGSLPGEPVY